MGRVTVYDLVPRTSHAANAMMHDRERMEIGHDTVLTREDPNAWTRTIVLRYRGLYVVSYVDDGSVAVYLGSDRSRGIIARARKAVPPDWAIVRNAFGDYDWVYLGVPIFPLGTTTMRFLPNGDVVRGVARRSLPEIEEMSARGRAAGENADRARRRVQAEQRAARFAAIRGALSGRTVTSTTSSTTAEGQ